MATLEIKTLLNETQMGQIVDFILEQLPDNTYDEIVDIDKEMFDIRVWVEFYRFCETTSIKVAEICDIDDGEVFKNDTAVLNARLEESLEEYNRDQAESLRSAMQILEDQRNWVMN